MIFTRLETASVSSQFLRYWICKSWKELRLKVPLWHGSYSQDGSCRWKLKSFTLDGKKRIKFFHSFTRFVLYDFCIPISYTRKKLYFVGIIFQICCKKTVYMYWKLKEVYFKKLNWEDNPIFHAHYMDLGYLSNVQINRVSFLKK